MPAVDELLARDLVTLLDANPAVLVNNIEFTWDAYHAIDQVRDDWLYVTPNRYLHTRLTRDVWHKSTILNFVFIVPAEVSVDESTISTWLERWDALVEEIKAATPLNYSLAEFEQEERFSVSQIQQRARLMFEASGTYPLRV